MKTRVLLVGGLLATIGWLVSAQAPDSVPPAFEKPANSAGQAAPGDAIDPFDSDPNAPKMVQVQVEFVEMSHETLTKLLFMAKPTSSDATKLRQTVQDMVERKEASVLETQLVIAKHAQKATTESIHEFIYPSGYEPPQFPDPKDATKTAAPPTSYPITPTEYDVKNLGSTLEVEPQITDDADIIDLRLVPELLWHTGNTPWADLFDRPDHPGKIEMPDFYVLRSNTSIFCKSGQYTLISVLSPKNAQGETDLTRKIMVFVKCDILITK